MQYGFAFDQRISIDDRRLVRAVMVRQPKTLPRGATVAEVRAVFANDHVHMALVVDGARLVCAIDPSDLRDNLDDHFPADRLGHLSGRVVNDDLPLIRAREILDATLRRRLAVVGPHGELVGLLCLKRTRLGYCSDRDVDARARERAGLPCRR